MSEHTAGNDAWTVTYRGVPLTLTRAEYLALKQAADDDPVEADRLAREHLARPLGYESWAAKHVRENPGHRAREGLYDPGSCDDCRERSPIYDLAARPIPPGETEDTGDAQ